MLLQTELQYGYAERLGDNRGESRQVAWVSDKHIQSRRM